MSSNLYHWTKRERAGLVILVSNDIATSTIPRLDLNKKGDTIPTVWIQLKNLNQKLDCIIGGVYRRSRTSADMMKDEFCQLQQQIICAAQTGKTVLVLGDINVDHNNPLHIMAKEANDLLAVVEAANMRHLPNQVPTWKSYGLHKLCKCLNRDCSCKRVQRSSCIDNAYVSLEARTCLRILDEAVTDHYPLLVELETGPIVKSTLKSIWRRDTSKMKALDFETSLGLQDWSSIYDTNDPNIILDTILTNVNLSLDTVAPLKEIKFRDDKPKLSLRLCNVSMATGKVPDLFKDAIVHPVYKGHGKDPRDPGSYRPVAILPSLSKVLEVAVRDALHASRAARPPTPILAL